MFNVGPMELMVLAIVGLIVLGPDRLPGLARDAARMLRTLRELATGARQQLRDELGPEFADVDLRNLNPRTAVQRAVFGDDFDLDRLNPRTAVRDAIFGDEDLRAADPRDALRETTDDLRHWDEPIKPVTMTKSPTGAPTSTPGAVTHGSSTNGARPRPRPRPGPPPAAPPDTATRYDDMT